MRSARGAALVCLAATLAVGGCGSTSHLTSTPSPKTGLASPDTTLPPPRPFCGGEPTSVVTVTINPDTPMPDCVTVRAAQRLRIVNNTNGFHQPGAVISAKIADLPLRTIGRGQSTTFDEPFGDYLARGEHYLQVSAYPGTNIIVWLK